MTSAYVYRIHDDDTGELLYIGSSSRPRSRLTAHRKRGWWPANPRVDIEEHPDRDAAYSAEFKAIDRERPVYNVERPPDPAALAEHIERVVREFGPLSDEQLTRIAGLLQSGGA